MAWPDFAKQQGLIGLGHEPEPGEDYGGSPEQAIAFRRRLVELGPAYIKLGQLLSTRPDLLPPQYIEELPKPGTCRPRFLTAST